VPYISKSNNRILPANARAADVAEKAVKEIVPVQQRRYLDAFRIQGIQCLAYNRLTSGRPCSCQSHQKQVQGLLDKEGKASPGVINELITGHMSFDVTPYRQGVDVQGGPNGVSSPYDQQDPNRGVFDISTTGEEFPFADVNGITEDFGDNGPTNPVDIDDLLNNFDTGALGWSDVACPICFGTGFVGGFTAFNSYRKVLTPTDVEPVLGFIDTVERPFVVRECQGWNQTVILPAGAVMVDSFKVWNGLNIVPTTFLIDNTPITNDAQLLSFCDGKLHLITAQFSGEFTHFEMQFGLSWESLYFEFPRRPQSADTSLLEQMEPFQIFMSPNIPYLNSMDVVVESQLGKVLVVQNVNPWVTRQLNILGPECQVRVIQPQEIFRILPWRGRIPSKPQTTRMTRDNQNGVYRT
jgi:hypothetical protein